MKKFQVLFAMLFVALFLIMPAKGITPAEKKLNDALQSGLNIKCKQSFYGEISNVDWELRPMSDATSFVICNISNRKGNDVDTVLIRANTVFRTNEYKYFPCNELSTFLGFAKIEIDGESARQVGPIKLDENSNLPSWVRGEYPCTKEKSDEFRKLDIFWKSVQSAAAANDAKALSKMIEYPFYHPFNTDIQINNTKDFHQYFKSIFSYKLKDFIRCSVIGFPEQEESDLDGHGVGVTRAYSYIILKDENEFTMYINVEKIKGAYKISSIGWQN